MDERRPQRSVRCRLAQTEYSGSPNIAVISFLVLISIREGPVLHTEPETNHPDTIFLLVSALELWDSTSRHLYLTY
jgi:hypothetical protein